MSKCEIKWVGTKKDIEILPLPTSDFTMPYMSYIDLNPVRMYRPTPFEFEQTNTAGADDIQIHGDQS